MEAYAHRHALHSLYGPTIVKKYSDQRVNWINFRRWNLVIRSVFCKPNPLNRKKESWIFSILVPCGYILAELTSSHQFPKSLTKIIEGRELYKKQNEKKGMKKAIQTSKFSFNRFKSETQIVNNSSSSNFPHLLNCLSISHLHIFQHILAIVDSK